MPMIVPDDEHVGRHCTPTRLEAKSDGTRALRTEAWIDETCEISVNRIEDQSNGRSYCEGVKLALQTLRAVRVTRPTHMLAVMNVGMIRQAAASVSQTVEVVTDPIGQNEQHCLIRYIDHRNQELLEVMCADVEIRCYSF